MRQPAGKLVRLSLIALFGWSALGLQLDMFSGPLRPEAALGELCELVLSDRSSDRQHAPTPDGVERSRQSALAQSCAGTFPSAAVEAATWPNPLIHVQHLPDPAKRVDGKPPALPFEVSANGSSSLPDAALPGALYPNAMSRQLRC